MEYRSTDEWVMSREEHFRLPKAERRSMCPRCGSTDLEWKAWGHYLDKDLVCKDCDYVVDIWDC